MGKQRCWWNGGGILNIEENLRLLVCSIGVFCRDCQITEGWRKKHGMKEDCSGRSPRVEKPRCPQLQQAGCCKPDFCIAKGRDVDGSDCEKCKIWPT